ncbi:MAG: electron transport complex subunit RsxC [Cellvibrionaceae bacterium]|nr:electron transport complex subunit RsxC [Cellvibrionaceae bacterium]
MIKVWDIPGGVHPPENKQQSMQAPLASISIPKTLILPLNQHLGVAAQSLVKVGDKVKAGDKIATATGVMSASVHAPTSGTISALEERSLPHPSGMSGPCIVIATDGKHTTADTTECEDYRQLDANTLLGRIREAGIVGLGGAGFPTAVKLNPGAETQIDTLILNGTECEPYITADDCLMQNYAQTIVKGAQLLAYILGNPQRIMIGIEDNKPDAIAAMREAASGTDIAIISFPTKYPSGGEKQLIQILTGKEVPSGKIPATLGIVVQNVGTAAAAYRAVRYGEPLTWRITTVVGESLQQQRNVKALLGTPIQHLLDEHGFDPAQCERLIMGGPMMGFTLSDAEVPVVKTTNCIIAPSTQEMPAAPPAQECIRCGMCAQACPASLLPQQLYWYAKAEEYERLQNHNLFDCIECGACSFVCPSAIPLVQYYRAAKGSIRQQEEEKIKSDHARQRFESRKQRLQAAEQAKEAKRQARKQAAQQAKQLAAQTAGANNPPAEAKTPASKPSDPKPTDTNNNTSDDPVAAAMARLQAKAQDPAAEYARLTRTQQSAQSRVHRLEQKLSDAKPEQQEQITAQLKQAQLRLQEAEHNLAKVTAPTPQAKQTTPSDKAGKNNTHSDVATAAIEKAKAASAAMSTLSATDKRKHQVTSLEKRLQKAQDKLARAEAENSEHLDLLRASTEKLATKLAEAQAALEQT